MVKKKRSGVEYTDSREKFKRRAPVVRDNVFNKEEFNFLHSVLLKGKYSDSRQVFKKLLLSLKVKGGVDLSKAEKVYVQKTYVRYVIEGGINAKVSDNDFYRLVGRRRNYYG